MNNLEYIRIDNKKYDIACKFLKEIDSYNLMNTGECNIIHDGYSNDDFKQFGISLYILSNKIGKYSRYKELSTNTAYDAENISMVLDIKQSKCNNIMDKVYLGFDNKEEITLSNLVTLIKLKGGDFSGVWYDNCCISIKSTFTVNEEITIYKFTISPTIFDIRTIDFNIDNIRFMQYLEDDKLKTLYNINNAIDIYEKLDKDFISITFRNPDNTLSVNDILTNIKINDTTNLYELLLNSIYRVYLYRDTFNINILCKNFNLMLNINKYEYIVSLSRLL